MLVARVRDISHGADVECASPTIKRTAGSRSAGARGAVKSEVEPLAGGVVQAAYMAEFDPARTPASFSSARNAPR